MRTGAAADVAVWVSEPAAPVALPAPSDATLPLTAAVAEPATAPAVCVAAATVAVSDPVAPALLLEEAELMLEAALPALPDVDVWELVVVLVVSPALPVTPLSSVVRPEVTRLSPAVGPSAEAAFGDSMAITPLRNRMLRRKMLRIKPCLLTFADQ